MPIASFKPDITPEVHPELPRIEPKNYVSVIYDDNNVPLTSLIAFVEGAPWTIDYYAQVVSKHNDLREQDINQDPEYQQYQKFTNLEIRVDQALTSTFDETNSLTTVTGSGYVYPFMKVNRGDQFVVETSDNKRSIFKITRIARRTYNRDSAWEIEYSLVAYVDDKPNLLADLEKKTIRTYFFSKERLIEGLQPFIKSSEYENVTNIRSVFDNVCLYYFKNIYSDRYNTLMIPGQEVAIYDSNLVQYLMKILSTDDAPEVRHVKVLPTDNDPYLAQPEFWQMLFERDYDMCSRCNDTMGLVSKAGFNYNTYLTGMRYSNLNYLVYPDNPDVSLNIRLAEEAKPIAMQTIIQTDPFKNQQYSDVDNTYVDGSNTYDIIHEVLSDNKYVLSAAFYGNTDTMSLLEVLTRDYMQHKSIDLNKLYAICNVFKKWKRLEQYYYGPILLTLLAEAYRAQYT